MFGKILVAAILGLATVAAPPASYGQHAANVPRIGFLGAVTPEDFPHLEKAFREGLREAGYVEGRNAVIERRYAGQGTRALAAPSAELARLEHDVVVTYGAIEELMKSSRTLPIVMTVNSDPVRSGVVASLARPGGQVTGLSDLHAGITSKRPELLKEVAPTLSRIGVLWNPDSTLADHRLQLKDLQDAASILGLKILSLEIKGPNDVDRAFATMKTRQAGGFVVVGDPVMGPLRKRMAELAIEGRLTSIGTVPQYAETGFLMSYGTDFHDLWRRAATYVDKILKGAKPGDLPIEQPTKFEFVVNLKTAKALGIKLPQSILLRADRVIE